MEQRHEHREVLAHVPDRLVERQAEHALDDDLVRQADAEHEAAAARGLHGERLLRHRQRMAAVGGHDAGGELDAGYLAADDREHAHRVESEDLGSAYDAKPSASAARASATTSSIVRPAVSPPKMPMLIDPEASCRLCGPHE